MIEFAHIIYQIVIWLFLGYSAAVFLIYAWMAIYAYGAVLNYKSRNTFTDYNLIVTNENAPRLSLIAPAYNEGLTIVENIRSLLSLYYYNLEIIIVNDGSKDDSIQKMIDAYDLEKVSYYIPGKLQTKEVKAVYKSRNVAFKKLVVVDKENGGKADALNVGVNISSGEYIVCIDVDCILEQDALLKLAKPFLEQSDKPVIACGGVIRLANNCQVENGKIVDVNIPKTWLGRSQALEYIRAFVLGRMAWSRASGLILISGAFGAFNKEIVLACGGYDSKTVGEDMELVVRMRRYMEVNKQPYQVVNIPDPLCWTEAPESKEILIRQRNRWMRGTIETLWKHRAMMLNPKYGKLGMVSLPYWFLFEFLGPLVEFFGFIIFIIFWVFGIINWSFFFALLALITSSGVLYSIYAILIDSIGYQVYTKRKDLFRLIITAIIEPFYFHPTVVKAGVQGAIDFFKKEHKWGVMVRQGFHEANKDLPWYKQVLSLTSYSLKQYTPIALLFYVLYLAVTGIELWWYDASNTQLANSSIGLKLFLTNIWMGLQTIFGIGIIYLVISYFYEKLALLLAKLAFSLIILVQFGLFLYYAESRNLLGADVFYYSLEEMIQILQSSGMLRVTNIVLVSGLVFFISFLFWFAIRRVQVKSVWPIALLFILGLFTSLVPVKSWLAADSNEEDEFVKNAKQSKWEYFIYSTANNYIQNNTTLTSLFNKHDFDSSNSNVDYPYLRNDDTKDILSAYLNKSNKTPNLVVIIVEGLGSAYSTPAGYVGSFTPFLDSLRKQSLFWSNNLSSSGRTFSVLPTLLGSLPFGSNGFLEQSQIPNHFNLYNILGYNGFSTGFYYGGESNFDNMRSFLEYSTVQNIVDEESYTSVFKKLPSNSGDSWGYEDQALFTNYLQQQAAEVNPYFNVLMTLSTHNPFLINRTSFYERLFDEHLNSAALSVTNKKWAKENRKQLVSVLSFDDALAHFFASYAQRADFNNTIFVITGDHAMPEIPLQTKIDRYHVPLLIYSPLLKQARIFKNTVSHFDLAPSLLAYYSANYNISVPKQVAWLGKGLNEGVSNKGNGIAMMQSKNQLIDFVYGNYHLVEDNLYKLDSDLREVLIDDAAAKDVVKYRFDRYKDANRRFVEQQKLIPDSIYYDFFKTIRKP